MELGIDVSTYFEVLDDGIKFYKDNHEIDPLDEFINNDVKAMRIRLWVDPYSNSGEKYLGGTCDMTNFLRLAKLAQSKGFKIYLDIHYSDFWADPGKQCKPKAWADLSFEDLVQKVYSYTLESLEEIKKNDIDLFMIQVGNEITNGILWPDGRLVESDSGERGNYKNLTTLLKSGIKACKEVFSHSLVMLHLERSYDHEIYKEFYSNMEKYGVEYDVIGASYYPYWHGTIEQLFYNLTTCRKMFNKKIAIAELGYAFTLEDYIYTNNGLNGLVINNNNLTSFNFKQKYPFTKEGQNNFIVDFLNECKKYDVHSVFYWEPLWLPGKNICWASTSGQEYIGELGKPTRNEWSNQCLFDYKGQMNPAFESFKK